MNRLTILMLLIVIGCSSSEDNGGLLGFGTSDSERIVGEWQIQSIDGEKVVRQGEGFRVTGYGIDFYEDKTCLWFLYRELDIGVFNSSTITGTYTIQGSNIHVELIEEDGDDFSFGGTYEIKGDILTIETDDNSTIVMKKTTES